MKYPPPMDAFAVWYCVTGGMNEPTQMPLHIAEKARRAALIGTRALIATESFDALVALLVAAEVIPVDRMQSCLTALSSTLKGHARVGHHPEFQVSPSELRLHAERLAVRAAEIGGAS